MSAQTLFIKGFEALAREIGQAPEQRAARRLGDVPSRSGPHVLFLTPRSWAVHVQWEATVARALAERGARVSFLTCGGGRSACDRVHVYEGPPMPCRTCAGYVHRSLDAHRHAWTPLSDGSPAEPSWPELDGLSLAELRLVEHRGLPLGRLVEVPTSWFLCNTDLANDPLGALTFRRFLRSGAAIVDEIEAALDRDHPDTVVMLNGLFLFEQIARAVCSRRDIDVVTYERGYVKGTVFFDRAATASRYDTSDLWPQFRDVGLTEPESAELDAYLADRRIGARSISDFWPAPRFDEPDPGFSVMFTNVTWDTAVQERDRCFANPREWIRQTLQWFVDHPDRRLIVRVHPAEVRSPEAWSREPVVDVIADAFPELPSNIRVIDPEDPTSSYPLMEGADVALVYTSTAGMESVLAGTPCVTAATTQFGGKGFTHDPPDAAAYFETLDRILAEPGVAPGDVELARRYAHFFFFKAAFRTDQWVWEPVPGLARVTDDLSVLRPDGDRDLDAICRGILSREPFTPPERGALPDVAER